MKEETFIGLDIGSENIKIAVGQRDAQGKIKIIGGVENSSEGISKGVINSFEDTVASISKTLEKVERMTGLPCEEVILGVTGTHILSQDSKGVVAVAKADGEIKEGDVERALEAAQAVATPPNYEIVHVLPQVFSVDNQNNIKDPIGMTGVRLEVQAKIIEGLSSQIKNLTKCVYRTGLEINQLVFNILAASEAVLTNRQKELGVAVIDIGHTTTSVAVFEEGDLLTAKVLPIGSAHITNDIALGLRVSVDIAEVVKLKFGSALPDDFSKRDEIDLHKIDEKEEEKVSQKHVAEIIEARVEEIFKMVDKELKEIDRSGKLPAGVVLCGQGVKLKGLGDVAKRVLRLSVGLGYPQDMLIAIDKLNDPGFAASIGLVVWGAQSQAMGSKNNLNNLIGSSVNKIFAIIKKLIKKFIP
ncbi:MAG: cell division protein FtsA [Patescibacteria group bacterium]|nr:cell division protein FtsA [Patescibacteria group bacterium]